MVSKGRKGGGGEREENEGEARARQCTMDAKQDTNTHVRHSASGEDVRRQHLVTVVLRQEAGNTAQKLGLPCTTYASDSTPPHLVGVHGHSTTQ